MRLNFTRAMCLVILLLPLALKAQTQIGMSDVLRPVDYTTDGTNQYVLTEYNIQVLSKTGSLVRKIPLPGGFFFTPFPVGIAHKEGKLYVAYQGNTIHVISTDGTYLKMIDINGTPAPGGQFGHDLHDIEIVGNNIYTTDWFFVRIYTMDGEPVTTFGTAGTGNGQFQSAWKLAVDENGNIYVTDSYLVRVQKFSSTGTYLATFATQGYGVGQLQSNGIGIVSDGAGNIFVSEPQSNLVHQFTTGGVFARKFNGGGRDLEFVSPNIVSAEKPDRVVTYTKSGSVVTTLGGHSSDAGKFNNPAGITFDAQGNFYVADRGNFRVQVFNNKGQFIRQFGSYGLNDDQFRDPKSIAVAKDGKIHIIDGMYIKMFNNDGTFIKQWGNYGSGGAGDFVVPKCLTVDKDDNIWIADTYNKRVQVFDKNLQFVKMINVSQNVLGLAVDDAGTMYVPDQSSGILKYDVNGNVSQIAWSGVNAILQANSVTVKGDKLYTVSRSGVSIFDTTGKFIASRNAFGAEPGEFIPDFLNGYNPIAISPSGEIFVADLLRVQVIKEMNYIKMDVLEQKIYGDAAFNLNATSTSGLPVTFESSDPTIASIDGKVVTIKKAGQVDITAKQAGDAANNIPAATPVKQTLNINKAYQEITFTAISEKRYGDPDFKLTATSNAAGAEISFASGYDGVFTVSNDVAHITGIGSVNLIAIASETENYFETRKWQLVKVSKGLQTITFDPIPPKILKDEEVVLPEFTSAGRTITYISGDDRIASISGHVATLKEVGSVYIHAYENGDQYWEAAQMVSRLLTINLKRPQKFTFSQVEPKHYGDAPFELVGTATSGLPVLFYTDDESIISIEGNIATIHKPGSVSLFGFAPGNDEYEASNGQYMLVDIAKGISTIDFKAIPEQVFIKGETLTLEATSAIALPVTFLVDQPEVATVKNKTITLVGPGTTVVRATTEETELYAAGETLQTLVVKLITGIEEAEPSGVIYPNPTTDYVYVRGNSQPIVINTIGQIFNAPVESVNKNLQKVNVSQLKAGIYFIKINDKAYKLVKE